MVQASLMKAIATNAEETESATPPLLELASSVMDTLIGLSASEGQGTRDDQRVELWASNEPGHRMVSSPSLLCATFRVRGMVAEEERGVHCVFDAAVENLVDEISIRVERHVVTGRVDLDYALPFVKARCRSTAPWDPRQTVTFQTFLWVGIYLDVIIDVSDAEEHVVSEELERLATSPEEFPLWPGELHSVRLTNLHTLRHISDLHSVAGGDFDALQEQLADAWATAGGALRRLEADEPTDPTVGFEICASGKRRLTALGRSQLTFRRLADGLAPRPSVFAVLAEEQSTRPISELKNKGVLLLTVVRLALVRLVTAPTFVLGAALHHSALFLLAKAREHRRLQTPGAFSPEDQRSTATLKASIRVLQGFLLVSQLLVHLTHLVVHVGWLLGPVALLFLLLHPLLPRPELGYRISWHMELSSHARNLDRRSCTIQLAALLAKEACPVTNGSVLDWVLESRPVDTPDELGSTSSSVDAMTRVGKAHRVLWQAQNGTDTIRTLDSAVEWCEGSALKCIIDGRGSTRASVTVTANCLHSAHPSVEAVLEMLQVLRGRAPELAQVLQVPAVISTSTPAHKLFESHACRPAIAPVPVPMPPASPDPTPPPHPPPSQSPSPPPPMPSPPPPSPPPWPPGHHDPPSTPPPSSPPLPPPSSSPSPPLPMPSPPPPSPPPWPPGHHDPPSTPPLPPSPPLPSPPFPPIPLKPPIAKLLPLDKAGAASQVTPNIYQPSPPRPLPPSPPELPASFQWSSVIFLLVALIVLVFAANILRRMRAVWEGLSLASAVDSNYQELIDDNQRTGSAPPFLQVSPKHSGTSNQLERAKTFTYKPSTLAVLPEELAEATQKIDPANYQHMDIVLGSCTPETSTPRVEPTSTPRDEVPTMQSHTPRSAGGVSAASTPLAANSPRVAYTPHTSGVNAPRASSAGGQTPRSARGGTSQVGSPFASPRTQSEDAADAHVQHAVQTYGRDSEIFLPPPPPPTPLMDSARSARKPKAKEREAVQPLQA